MRVLFMDAGGDFLIDLAMRCQDYGHDVKYYKAPIKPGIQSPSGKGLIDIVTDLAEVQNKWIHWSELCILADNTTYMKMADAWRALGHKVFGCNVPGAAWELEREIGQAVIKKTGLPLIPSQVFHDYPTALAYVAKHAVPMVSKPNGAAATENKALSYVAHDAADLTYTMQKWAKNPKYVAAARKDGFILQEKISGIEYAVGGWFNGKTFSRYFLQNHEYKKHLNAGLGPNTGEMGTLTMYVTECELANRCLLPLIPQLKKIGYVGFIDASFMIKEDGTPAFMEFTMRFGYPLIHNQVASHLGDPVMFMRDMLDGKDTLEVEVDKACISIVMTLPPFPHHGTPLEELWGIPVYLPKDRKNIHLTQAHVDTRPEIINDKLIVDMPGIVTSGDQVLVVTGLGDTITGARKSAYSTIKKIKIPASPGYRTDIGGDSLVKNLPKLQAMGYAMGFKY